MGGAWKKGGQIVLWIAVIAVLGGSSTVVAAGDAAKGLRVSENHRYLEYRDGTPFFYLGDTAWELFHRPPVAARTGFSCWTTPPPVSPVRAGRRSRMARMPAMDYDRIAHLYDAYVQTEMDVPFFLEEPEKSPFMIWILRPA